ncbi:hypothetical protein BSI_30680 [Bacillus inaquosorum KCTC 13429]|uniref:Uncharacterized protein n=1 Tax=Bacillus inaquosorum KCTC 13429 TaxID=1236548 RepID=A0A9W5LH60_9BACI|nr:hypothetical protein BSI_30680 [Bacillus inaquosorum KCTC 13429]
MNRNSQEFRLDFHIFMKKKVHFPLELVILLLLSKKFSEIYID